MTQLLGQLRTNGQAASRSFAFKPMTGHVEASVMDQAIDHSDCLPRRITHILTETLEYLGDTAPTPQHVALLCVADRQFLMRRLAILLGLDQRWETHHCKQCGSAFDVFIRLSDLPVKPAGEGFPFVSLKTNRGRWKFRLPNGEDQEVIASIEDEQAAVHQLVQRCTVESPSSKREIDKELLDQIDQAMEQAAPAVSTQVVSNCPACGQENLLEADPYECIRNTRWELFSEVHTLARFYHWSQQEILSMPQTRRKLYVKLIDRYRGLTD